ncbi:MAG: NFACT family protein [Armatimonadetes bacterium]|nr:NFACT family protein [Armatimonadota bacterium]
MLKISFDAVCLRAIQLELTRLEGARAQKWLAVDDLTVAVQLYLQSEVWLTISMDAERPRIFLSSARPSAAVPPTAMVSELRKRLNNARLVSSKQRGLDRVIDLVFSAPEEEFTLTAELMGKHSNLILRDSADRMVGAAKWLSIQKSRRAILPGQKYSPPPFPSRPSFLKAGVGDSLKDFEGVSPTVLALVGSLGLEDVQRRVRGNLFRPWMISEGAYPLELADSEIKALARADSVVTRFESFSEAVVAFAGIESTTVLLERTRLSLVAALGRVLLAREVAQAELQTAADTASRATQLQQSGELILAYATQIKPGQTELEVMGYDGEPLSIPLNPELTPVENSQRLFRKAKKAKDGAHHVREQLERIGSDVITLNSLITLAKRATTPREIDEVKEEAAKRRFTTQQAPQPKTKEERPYQGFAVREVLAPGGWLVLYGENAEGNDHLTVRVAKPNDWWLHVRGGPSAHVIIRTNNQPLKVQRETFEFAAKVSAKHSSSKHSNLVPVDYTLKKYVRRAKGAGPGSVTYTHEKTLHVEP